MNRSRLAGLVMCALVVMGAVALAGCSQQPTTSSSAAPTTTTTKPAAPAAKPKVAMVTDVAMLGDKGLNDLTWAGLQKAKSQLGVDASALESTRAEDYSVNLAKAAADGDTPVFAVGFLMTQAVTDAATQTPKTDFAGVDVSFASPPSNLLGITFKEQDAGYLAGVVAGMSTKATFSSRLNTKNVIGFVGGLPIPSVQAYEAGFKAGAKSVDPSVKVISLYANSFDDQAKGKSLGRSLIASGADVIFAAARQTGIGTYNACKQSKKALFIGSETDQFLTLSAPGATVLTSAMKFADNAVFAVVKQTASGSFPGGQNLSFGIKEDGVGLAPFHGFDAKVPQSIKAAVAKAIAAVKAGTVTVPDGAVQ